MKNKYRITAECIRGDSEHYPERSDKMAIGLHKTIHIQHWAPYYSLHDLFWIGCHPTPGTNKDKSAQRLRHQICIIAWSPLLYRRICPHKCYHEG